MRRLALIAAASVIAAGAAAQDDPGTGDLLTTIDGRKVSLPLVALDVDLAVTGTLVRGSVEQTFENPTDTPLEAVYVFPLPEGAAVDYLALDVAGRRFAGVVKEKEDARRTYERAKETGKGAGLVEQHRPNLFRTSVANIPPRARVTVSLSFLDDADWQDGVFSTVMPLTVTPRFAEVHAAFAFTPALPEAHVRVAIEAGIPIAWVRSPSHALTVLEEDGVRTVERTAVAADRDLVLRWKPEEADGLQAGALVEVQDDARYVSVMVVPPALDDDARGALPTETVFVVDVSGSMDGTSIEQARMALSAALDRLRPGDSFALIRFSDGYDLFRERLAPAGPAELDAARAWVRGLSAGGGTEILPALLAALELAGSGDPHALRRVVLVTDGAVGNEEEVLTKVAEALGETRLHVVGIGSAPNRWLMAKLARTGRGVAEFVGSLGEVGERIDALLARTERAIVTDVAIEGADPGTAIVLPDPVPDLYAGRPLVVTMRLPAGAPIPKLTLWGRTARGPVTVVLPLDQARDRSGIGTRWARKRIEALEDTRRLGADPGAVRDEVVELAKRFSLVTDYTSFVVVEDDEMEEHLCREGLDELPAGGTIEPLLLAIGAALAAGGALVARAGRVA